MIAPDFSVEAKSAARAHLGMTEDEPNAASGFAARLEFDQLALIFDSGRAEGEISAAEAIFARVKSTTKAGKFYQLHENDLRYLMAEHGVTE